MTRIIFAILFIILSTIAVAQQKMVFKPYKQNISMDINDLSEFVKGNFTEVTDNITITFFNNKMLFKSDKETIVYDVKEPIRMRYGFNEENGWANNAINQFGMPCTIQFVRVKEGDILVIHYKASRIFAYLVTYEVIN